MKIIILWIEVKIYFWNAQNH